MEQNFESFDWANPGAFRNKKVLRLVEEHMYNFLLLNPKEITVSFNRKTLKVSTNTGYSFSIPGRLRQLV